MSSSEEVSYPILKKHDVDYVLVIFGGLLGYSGFVSNPSDRVLPFVLRLICCFVIVMTSTSSFGWSGSLRASGRRRFRSETSSPREESTKWTRMRASSRLRWCSACQYTPG